MSDENLENIATALERLSEELDVRNLATVATHAAQLARRVDAKAAETLEEIGARSLTVQHDSTKAKLVSQIRGTIDGVAEATRLDGAAVSGTSSSNVFSIYANASASATATANAMAQVESVLADPDLPEEAREVLEGIKEAAEAGDRAGVLRRAADWADLVTKFPILATKFGSAIELITGLI